MKKTDFLPFVSDFEILAQSAIQNFQDEKFLKSTK